MSERARDETHDLRLSKQAAFTTAPDLPQSYDIIWGTKLTLNDTKPETEVCFVYRLSHIWFVSHILIKDTSLKNDNNKLTPLLIYGLTTIK